MASFYLFLPSNTNEDNTLTKFTTKLPETMRLDGEWEVSLVELTYTRSWFNIGNQKDASVVIYSYPKPDPETGKNKLSQTIPLVVPLNHYETPTQLIDGMTFAMHDRESKIPTANPPQYRLLYDPVLGRTVFEVYEPNVTIYLSEKMAYMLGFDRQDVSATKRLPNSTVKVADHPPDMDGGINALYVYCNVVAPQIVGNTYSNLLRAVTVSGNFNENITNIYTDRIYIPVLKKVFDSIEININDDAGRPILFEFGKTFVTLHFRKRRI